MANGINIGVAADTQAFDRGVRNGIVEPLEDAEQQLETLARAGERAGDDLEHAFQGQQRETEDLQRATQRLNREIEEGSSRSSRAVQQHTTETSHRSRESVRELGNEARANAAETFSSFDGSAQSFADGLQGTFGGIIGSLGPVGAIAGAVAAAGIGLLGTAFSKAQEQAEALKEKIGEMTTDMIDAGRAGDLSFSYVVDQMKTLASETDKSKDSLTSLRKDAEKAGVSVKDFQLANAGAAKATNKALKEARDELDKLNDKISDQGGSFSKAENRKQNALGATIGKLLDVQKAQKDAAQSAKDYFDSGAADIEQAGEASQSYAEAVQSAYADAGSAIDDYVTKGKFDLDAYQKATEKNAEAIVKYQANMADAQAELAKAGHDKAIQYLETLGPEAAPLIAAFIKAPEAQQDSLAKTWDKLGGTASTSFGSSLQSKLDAQVPSQTVVVNGDFSNLDRALRERQNIVVKAKVTADGIFTPGGKLVK